MKNLLLIFCIFLSTCSSTDNESHVLDKQILLHQKCCCSYENESKQLGNGVLSLNTWSGECEKLVIYSNDSLDQELKIIGLCDTDSLVYPFCPFQWKPDYGIINFIVTENNKNCYKVVLGYDKEGYIKKDSIFTFYNWSDFITHAEGVIDKSNSRQYGKVRFVDGDSLIMRDTLEGAEIKIRWRNENKLLVSFTLLM